MNEFIKIISNESYADIDYLTINEINNATTSIFDKILQNDPNWFYSASAQSAAAIVGLMGAIIITKIINEKAFTRQINKEIEEYKTKINCINDELKPKKEWLNKVNQERDIELVDDFLINILTKIKPDNPPSLNELYDIAISDPKYGKLDKTILKNKYDHKYYIKVIELGSRLTRKFLAEKSLAIKHNDTPLSLDNLYEEAIFDENYRKISKKSLEKQYKKNYLDIIALPNPAKIKNFTDQVEEYDNYINCLRSSIINYLNKGKLEKYKNYKDEIIIKESELSYYTILLTDKSKHVGNNEEIVNLRRYFLTLLLFSIFGLFLPLGMMLFDYNTMNKFRPFIFCLILVGWVAILIHLFLDISNLLKTKKE